MSKDNPFLVEPAPGFSEVKFMGVSNAENQLRRFYQVRGKWNQGLLAELQILRPDWLILQGIHRRCDFVDIVFSSPVNKGRSIFWTVMSVQRQFNEAVKQAKFRQGKMTNKEVDYYISLDEQIRTSETDASPVA